MKILNLNLFTSPVAPVSSIKMGEVFLHLNRIYLRTKPVAWMLNSTLIQDKMASGYVFATDLETGKFTTLLGSQEVEVVNVTLTWKK